MNGDFVFSSIHKAIMKLIFIQANKGYEIIGSMKA
jgi:hypothetical protein